MTKLNLILFAVLLASALGTVTSQHKARKLVAAHEREQTRARQIDVEWGQLQLEQSTWAMHQRIERLASERLHMAMPEQQRVQIVQSLAQPRATP